MSKSKSIGTAAETAVVRAARTRGFPQADRLTLTGATDRGDVGLCPGVIVEVKSGRAAEGASDALIARWLVETATERVNAGADVAFLVTKRPGVGTANAHRWWAHMLLGDFLRLLGADGATARAPDPGVPLRLTAESVFGLLRATGYGEPLVEPAA